MMPLLETRATDGACYTIHIREQLDARWADWFDPMRISSGTDGTVLTGYLPDQPALHAMITKVGRLGLYLVSVNPMDS
jgi:hypothetical protein